jgi:hypothetical protein
VAGDVLAEALAHRRGERGEQLVFQRRIIDHGAVFQRALETSLVLDSSTASSGRVSPCPLVARRAKSSALASPSVLRSRSPASSSTSISRATRARPTRRALRDRQASACRRLSSSTRCATSSVIEESNATRSSSVSRAARLAGQRDLDVDLVVRTIDAGRIVDEVGIDAATLKRELDAPGLRGAQVGAFAHHLHAQSAPFTRNASLA